MNKTLLTAAAVALFATSTPICAQQMTTKQQVVGTWKVVTLKTTSAGKVSHPLGDHPAGYVSVTPTRIWLLFVDSTRKAPAAPTLTDAEAVAAMKSSVAWTGRYVTTEQTPDGLKLTAHVDTATSGALDGADRVYFMRVDDNRLMMKSPGVVVPMTGALSIVEIELVKAD
jgi:Lipocalin-like domain